MLINQSTGKVIIEDVRIAKSPLAKLKGLMFERKASFDYALIMPLYRETRIGASIHMFFVFFPITAAFVDWDRRVVDKTLLKPFTPNYTPKKKCSYIIELPAEKFGELDTGDLLKW